MEEKFLNSSLYFIVYQLLPSHSWRKWRKMLIKYYITCVCKKKFLCHLLHFLREDWCKYLNVKWIDTFQTPHFLHVSSNFPPASTPFSPYVSYNSIKLKCIWLSVSSCFWQHPVPLSASTLQARERAPCGLVSFVEKGSVIAHTENTENTERFEPLARRSQNTEKDASGGSVICSHRKHRTFSSA